MWVRIIVTAHLEKQKLMLWRSLDPFFKSTFPHKGTKYCWRSVLFQVWSKIDTCNESRIPYQMVVELVKTSTVRVINWSKLSKQFLCFQTECPTSHKSPNSQENETMVMSNYWNISNTCVNPEIHQKTSKIQLNDHQSEHNNLLFWESTTYLDSLKWTVLLQI